ncbi:MAG: 30S ribosomal protein S3 [Chloroflexi bacterium]|nr:30S ribosomal protein S3 [Chloroflexota bacterium]
MGNKVHPVGLRLGLNQEWQARWFAEKEYAKYLVEDMKVRRAMQQKYREAGISRVDIERQSNTMNITLHTSRPGVVIGRGGQRVEEVRQHLEKLTGNKVKLTIEEIRQPELDAYLVAKGVAEQMERRIAFRRAIKQAIARTIQAGAKGIRIMCSGRLGGGEIARRQTLKEGRLPLQTLRANIDFGLAEARTTMGRIGVKVWIYKGDIIPEKKAQTSGGSDATAQKG